VGFGDRFEVTRISFEKVVLELFPFGCEAASHGAPQGTGPMRGGRAELARAGDRNNFVCGSATV